MKPSARVALIVALAATTAPTWASLPFYSPSLAYDSTTNTGYKAPTSFWIIGELVSRNGKAANTFAHYESNVYQGSSIAVWRGQTAFPSPESDSVHTSLEVIDINGYGLTCGYTVLSGSDNTQAAIWQPDGARIDLPYPSTSFPGDFESFAYDMNDAGIAVGSASKLENNTTLQRPVYWTSQREVVELMNPLSVPNEAWTGFARSIGTNGFITGDVRAASGMRRAMRWHVDGSAVVLSTVTTSGLTLDSTYGYTTSDNGAVAGWGELTNGANVGVLWTSNGEAIELQDLPNPSFQNTEVYAINNNHKSVGKAMNSSNQEVAVRWSSSGEPTVLDRLTDITTGAYQAFDINDFDYAVGRRSSSVVNSRAVLWTPDGDAIEMNSLVQPNDEWNFIVGSTITNTGWISGLGNFDPTGPAAAYLRPFSILVPFAGTYGMGDANFDESIDFADLLIVAQNYGTQTSGSFDVGDFNLDGSVNFTDLLAIAQNYGDVFAFESDWEAARGMVPEPNLIGGLIGVGLMMRRRSR